MRISRMTLAVLGSLCLACVSAPALSATPAMFGAGRMPIAYAANAGNRAWIATTEMPCPSPIEVTGWIQMSVLDASPTDSAESSDRANVAAQVNYNGARYGLKLTCLSPVGEKYSHFGGVGLLRPIFGTTGIGPAELPRTLAYVIVFGNATITKDGQTIAENQPVMAGVTQAIHDSSHRIAAESDPAATEMHLYVAGSQEGGTAVPGFPKGCFYIYWPSAALDLRNIGGTVDLTEISEVVVPEGPRARVKGVVQEAGIRPLKITLADKTIYKSATKTPAGLYDVTIRNESRRRMGIFMQGTDLCCTEFNRFSNVLAPGKHQRFRFYFAPGKVMFRELLSCTHREKTCAIAKYGSKMTSIVFE